jgi:hypothetical protein
VRLTPPFGQICRRKIEMTKIKPQNMVYGKSALVAYGSWPSALDRPEIYLPWAAATAARKLSSVCCLYVLYSPIVISAL